MGLLLATSDEGARGVRHGIEDEGGDGAGARGVPVRHGPFTCFERRIFLDTYVHSYIGAF